MLECTASVMIAIEPVTAPATTFSAIRIVFETIDSRAAPNLVDPLTASGAISGVSRRARGGSPSPARRRAHGRIARGSHSRARAPRGRGG